MVSDCHKEFNTGTCSWKKKKSQQKQANFTAQWSPLKQLTDQCSTFINTQALSSPGSNTFADEGAGCMSCFKAETRALEWLYSVQKVMSCIKGLCGVLSSRGKWSKSRLIPLVTEINEGGKIMNVTGTEWDHWVYSAQAIRTWSKIFVKGFSICGLIETLSNKFF